VRLCLEALEDRLTPSFTPVADTTAYPFSAVVEMNVDIHGNGLSCTGVLIDPTHVLTSAHCLYDPSLGGYADAVDVFAGRNGENFTPFGDVKGTRWVVNSNYVSGTFAGLAAFDLGVVTLATPLGNQTGTFGLSGATPTSYFDTGGAINTLGYPGDTFSGVNQYAASGKATDADANEIHWRLSSVPIQHGSSGSPVYILQNNQPYVVGVLSEFTDVEGFATRITAAKFNWIVAQLSSTATGTASAAVPPPTVAHTPGVFDPATATWYLRGANASGAPDITPFSYGGAGWTPVTGDWDGDGVATIGVVAPDATWYLRNSNSSGAPDIDPFQFGRPGWIPVVGDWNGTGVDSVGMFDPSTATWYLRETNDAGLPDITPFQYGAPGWIPVVGDWNGDGTTTIGVVDPTTETWYLRNSNSPGGPDIAPFRYGAPGWRPIAADWNGDGKATIGVIDPNETWYLRNSNGPGAPDYAPFAYGAPGWGAMEGAWFGLNNPLQTNGKAAKELGVSGGGGGAPLPGGAAPIHAALVLPTAGGTATSQADDVQGTPAPAKDDSSLVAATTINTTI
jgi:V8-like Glu-specific endopeptidase